jgi:serine phosphatase RsbU (regulator of sigma subunit)
MISNIINQHSGNFRNVIFLACLSVFFTGNTESFGQQNIDSLFSLLKTAKHDTIKIKLRAELGEEIPVLRISYWDSIRVDAEKWNLKKTIAQAINNIGFMYDDQGDLAKALDYYRAGLAVREEIGDNHGIAESLNNIAIGFEKQGDIPHALEYQFRGLKMQEEIGDKRGISLSLNNIAYIYECQDDVPKALEYYQKSLTIGEEQNFKDRIATELNNIGLVYRIEALGINKPGLVRSDSLLNKSLENFERALSIFLERKDNQGISTIYQNMGMIYRDKNDYSRAMEYFNKSLSFLGKADIKRGMTSLLAAIEGLYLDKNDYGRALSYGQRALKLANELGYPKDISISASMLSDVYQATNKWHDAFKMQKLYFLMRDSINNETTRKASLKKQFQYEYEKKEVLLKADQEKERAVNVERSRKQKIVIWSIIAGLILVLVFAALIYRSLRVTRKQKKVIEVKNRETEIQKKIIEEKNKDITDSINYARRIQQAKLPDKQEIYLSLKQCFILFKPKDIVSGDFYFFHKNQQSVFIAAVDCTGHGVPGAFMSMIGSEKLNEAISMSSDTSEILKQLNIGIKKSLHQSDSSDSTHDGMDIALCAVDIANRVVKYAGANRPIWIIRKDQNEIEEIQATKSAIGGYTEEIQSFETHEIKLSQGDTFYIFSDGYADTYGGVDRKKLRSRKFKEILLGIQDREMSEQEKYLDDFIENWKSGIEQVDDILVIGVRL